MLHPRSNPARGPLAAALAATALCVAALAGCAAADGPGLLNRITPYTVEVVQGNVVTKEMAQQLRAGLSREQVRGLLGSPLLTDVFHGERWDYVFAIRRKGTEPQQRRVSLWFEADRLARFDLDELPSEKDFVASIDSEASGSKPPVLELSEAQLKALPTARAATAAVPAASAPPRTYPPLEPVNR